MIIIVHRDLSLCVSLSVSLSLSLCLALGPSGEFGQLELCEESLSPAAQFPLDPFVRDRSGDRGQPALRIRLPVREQETPAHASATTARRDEVRHVGRDGDQTPRRQFDVTDGERLSCEGVGHVSNVCRHALVVVRPRTVPFEGISVEMVTGDDR